MTSDTSASFPDLNIPYFKGHTKRYFVPKFEDIPLERVVLYEYPVGVKEYALIFEIGLSWAELWEKAHNKIQSLEDEDISNLPWGEVQPPEDQEKGYNEEDKEGLRNLDEVTYEEKCKYIEPHERLSLLLDKHKEEPDVALLLKLRLRQEKAGFNLTFVEEDNKGNIKAILGDMKDEWGLCSAFKKVYWKEIRPADYLKEWDFFIKMQDEPIPEGILLDGTHIILWSRSEAQIDDDRRLEENHPMNFSHSPDYRSVTKNGKNYSLTTNQAAIIQLLHEAFKNGNPEISQELVFDRIGSDAYNPRIRDTFKSNPEASKELIVPGKRKGLIRLNI